MMTASGSCAVMMFIYCGSYTMEMPESRHDDFRWFICCHDVHKLRVPHHGDAGILRQ
ncbi:hypothetical protein DPMN_067710 [Dreissena polymorpha]|uniref:Uncharacterized protein n=1 Tax=Dreissena polymorpha TaxID=45954 RepID=A0A9D3YVR5_DREPO|nr:hypothetical protein DPMN_067710 [Dreissena polymorpha]